MGRLKNAWAALSETKADALGSEMIVNPFLPMPTISDAQLEAAINGAVKVSSMAAAALTWVARNFAEPPLVALRDGTPDPAHPLSIAFSRPTLWHSQTWMFKRLAYALLTDERGCYLVAALDSAGEIGALWVRSSAQVRPIIDPQRYIAGYEWVRNGIPERLDPSRFAVARFSMPSPDMADEFGSFTPLSQVRSEVKTNAAAGIWLDYSLQNMGAKTQAIGVDYAGMDPKTAKALGDEMNERIGGAHNARKIAVMAGKINAVDIGTEFADMDFGALTDRTEIAISRAFGIPAEVLQTLVTATKGAGLNASEYRAKERQAYSNTIVPMWKDVAESVGTFFGSIYGLEPGEVAFDTSEIPAMQADLLAVGPLLSQVSGFLEVNEGRAFLGLPPVPWGAGPPATVALTQRVLAGRTEPVKSIEVKALDVKARGALLEAKATTLEPRFEAIARKVFGKEKQAVLAEIKSRSGIEVKAAADGIDEQAWVDAFLDEMTVALGGGAKDAAASLGATFDITNPRAIDAALQRTLQLAGDVTGTTRKQVNDLAAQAITEGWSPDDLASRISEDVFGAAQITNRSKVIARTETLMAQTQGGLLGAKEARDELGLRVMKSWVTAGDGDVRELHLAAEAQGPIPVDDVFEVGAEAPGEFDDAAENIQCRCVLVYDAE